MRNVEYPTKMAHLQNRVELDQVNDQETLARNITFNFQLIL